MSRKSWIQCIALVASGVLFLGVATILPLTSSLIFASPDETAVAAFARNGTWDTGFRLPTHIPDVLENIGGLHPRSMVQQGDVLVPVGFLGMPLMVLLFEQLMQGAGIALVIVLILSAAFPLFSLASFMGKRGAMTAVIVYLTFPTVVLYANRAFFPNLPVVALGLWAVWLMRMFQTKKDIWVGLAAGVATGLAFTIRPVEALWLAPWIIWSSWRASTKRKSAMVFSMMAVCLVGYLAAVKTYGSWTPVIGYWVSDALPVAPSITPPVSEATFSLRDLLPFGLHPRVMWENIRLFLVGMLGFWMGTALLGIVFWMRDQKQRAYSRWIPIGLGLWTGAVLLLLYGQSLYADNINGTITIGNSFLRYLLPLVPLIAIGIGMLVTRVSVSMTGAVFAGFIIVACASCGIWMALIHDEEGVLSVQRELIRYESIRRVAEAQFPPETVMLSERGDKIFAGLPFAIVSPLPPQDRLDQIAASGVRQGLFHRFLTKEEKQTFLNGLVKDWLLVSVFENEALYISPAASSTTP